MIESTNRLRVDQKAIHVKEEEKKNCEYSRDSSWSRLLQPNAGRRKNARKFFNKIPFSYAKI